MTDEENLIMDKLRLEIINGHDYDIGNDVVVIAPFISDSGNIYTRLFTKQEFEEMYPKPIKDNE